MTIQTIIDIFNSMDVPIYDTQVDDEDFNGLETPYAAYLINNDVTIYADGVPWYTETLIDVELYVDKPRSKTEKEVDRLFKQNNLQFFKNRIFHDDEDLWEILYTIQEELTDDDNGQ